MSLIWKIEKQLMRKLGLSPMRRVIKGLKRRGVDVGKMQALDMFAGDGTGSVLCYSDSVQHLEAWELNPELVERLKKNLPRAVIRQVDSYEQMRVCEGKFDLIVIEAPLSLYGPNLEYCEHIGLFPRVLDLCKDDAVLILAVATEVEPLRQYVGDIDRVGTPEHLKRRAEFYKTDNPENIPLDKMVSAYSEHCTAGGFEVEWWFAVRRRYAHTLALKIRKRAS
ncbi:MAG: hypothetical protein N3B12_01890 [Armatimonadetes bacterium]|nr:hypothetical protein [Armatimonadota bacterium]